jgi:hypothetical protein
MPIDIKAVLDAKRKVLKPEAQGLKANPQDLANLKKLKQQKAKEDLDAVNKGVAEDAEESKKSAHESTNITNFIKAISQKNYVAADKYLQSAVNARLKASISKAVENSK